MVASTRREGETIYRKTSCACGGGCPACQSDAGNLDISQPGDPAEIAADRMADSVMGMAPGDAARAGNDMTAPGTIHRKSRDGENAESPDDRGGFGGLTGSLGPGRALDRETRDFFEPRFGVDLRHVRVHTGARATESANAVDALAFTAGRDIVFGEGQYQPASAGGRKLLAHELAHAVSAGRPGGGGDRQIYRQHRPDAEWHDVITAGRREAFTDRAGATSRMRALERQNPGQEFQVVASGRTFVIQSRARVAAEGGAPVPTAPPDARTRPDAGTDAGTAAGTGGGTGTAPGTARSPAPVFALTFDDGPHAAALGSGTNLTENVLNKLDTKGLKGKAAFFIQTAALDDQGHAMRGSSPNGRRLVDRMHRDGYGIGIHTGGPRDHESHPSAYAAGRLSSELTSAESFVHGITGSDPHFVRAPYGNIGSAGSATRIGIEGIYSTLHLTHLHWDIDGDHLGARMTLPQLTSTFDTQFAALRRTPAGAVVTSTPSSRIVALYHDIRPGTSGNIGDLIDHIRTAVPGATFEQP